MNSDATKSNIVNIASHLPAMARHQPDALAVVVQGSRAADGRHSYEEWTAAKLNEESDRVAHGLMELGIVRGTRTVLMVTPSLAFFSLTFALFKVGAVPVMVDPGMGVRNLKTCLEEAQPEAFIGVTKAHVARLILGWAKSSRINVTVGPRLAWGGATYARLREASPEFDMAETQADEMAAILYTSGSTGIPKGAVYTHGNFDAQVQALKNHYGIEPGERDLATFPLFALFGPALGMASVVPDMDASKPITADPANIVAAIEDWQTTNLFVSPALIEKVGRYGTEKGIKFESVKRVISAGAPARTESVERFESLLPDSVEVLPSYGATEALPLTSIGSRELIEKTANMTEAGKGLCVGRAIGDAQLEIISITDDPIETWSDDLRLPDGEVGEICVRGSVVTERYYGREASTALAKIHAVDGVVYHRMGDVGYLDDEGRLWFCGRKAHRVDAGESTLFTICCERVFDVHPKVRRTALVGVAKGGTIMPVLCVELEEAGKAVLFGTIEDELRELGATHEGARRIQTFLLHPKFPVDVRHNAKIFREELARWAEGKCS